MAEDFKGYKRINFSTGFQTTADDWNDLPTRGYVVDGGCTSYE